MKFLCNVTPAWATAPSEFKNFFLDWIWALLNIRYLTHSYSPSSLAKQLHDMPNSDMMVLPRPDCDVSSYGAIASCGCEKKLKRKIWALPISLCCLFLSESLKKHFTNFPTHNRLSLYSQQNGLVYRQFNQVWWSWRTGCHVTFSLGTRLIEPQNFFLVSCLSSTYHELSSASSLVSVSTTEFRNFMNHVYKVWWP